MVPGWDSDSVTLLGAILGVIESLTCGSLNLSPAGCGTSVVDW
jgi:hypothetical protein